MLSKEQQARWDKQAQLELDLWEECGRVTAETARRLGVSVNSLQSRLTRALAKGMKPRVSPRPPPQPKAPTVDAMSAIPKLLRRGPMTIHDISRVTGLDTQAVASAIDDLRANGVSIHQTGDRWEVTAPQSAHVHGAVFEFLSRPDNTFVFGATSDNHLCSKYSRLEVLNDLYDRFERAGVQAVFNAGNWIDGEARFNKHDLLVHGMDNQLAYLASHYPRRGAIKTYAVAGDDHEGWYAQREGVDIGRYAELKMRDAGRDDWVNLGYMEAHVRLVNANTGAASVLAVVHPGGGSAYAVSYTVQKIIESLDGGEKPAVGLYGHYHKLACVNVRNVWTIQTGCTQDQTPFMRKKKIDAHVGGVVLGLEQDPDTGAITGCSPQLVRFFVKGYYQGRWNPGGAAALADRTP
jgi:hypothetical protein